MTQLPATLPQPGAALGKQRVPAPPGGQHTAGLKGSGGDNAPGQDAPGEDVPQFMVPNRVATSLPEKPVNATKPTTQAVLPEVEQLSVDAGLVEGDTHVAVVALPEPQSLAGDADPAVEERANPDRSVAAAHDVLPVVGHGPSIGGQTPVARLRSTMASLASLELRSSGVQAKPGAAVTLERASGETSENSGRLDGQTHKPVGAGLDRAPGPAVSPARFQSMMSARVDARRPSQSSPQAGIKTAGSGDANIKMEATQAGRPEVKVTIVHQETHFGSAPLQEMQLAGGRSGRSGTIAQPGQSAIVPASVSSSQPGPMRVLHLHLEPAELGGVVVKMNMKGEALTVQIQPQLPRTALMLRSDSAALNSILQAAGVLADNASVQILEPSSNSHGSGNGMWASSQDADQSGSAQRGNADAGEGQRSGTSEEQDDAKQSVQDGQGDPGLSGVRSELYL